MWIAIVAVVLIALIGGIIYLTAGFHRFGFIQNIAQKNKTAAWLMSFAAVAVMGAILGIAINLPSMAIVMVHLFFIWLFSDIVSAVVSKIRKSKPKRNYAGVFALAFTTVYFCFGWYFAHSVKPVYYSIETEKNIGADLRIAMFADSHLGITLDGEKFAEQMKRIEAEEPDIILLVGDFVDDSSCKADMVRACEAMGEMKSKYGVYFTFGNHDKGYSLSNRDFGENDIREQLQKNGIKILEDESVMLTENIRLIGRQDKSEEERDRYSKIASDTDRSLFELYDIVMDHQPNDYYSESENCADLVVSGHTHGGHFFPAGYIGVAIGANDAFYGHKQWEVLGNRTDCIITSGISGWAIPFKTGTRSEYVIIDISQKKG